MTAGSLAARASAPADSAVPCPVWLVSTIVVGLHVAVHDAHLGERSTSIIAAVMALLGALLLAASIDGAAALRHASALAALGPHPWGSTRNEAAAQYVAAQMRAAGLDVELQRFAHGGITGTNVVGTLRGPGDDFVVLGAHHDTAPEAPGAYDDGGGVGVLLEVARVLAAQSSRPRTLVFASFDGEEAWSTGKGTTAGSRAFVERLGPRARSMVAAFAVEMSGWKGGAPVLHPIAYADPRGRGRAVVAPAWLVRAALAGAREAGSPMGVGDPYLSWLYQPAVRTFRVRLYGDDLSFLQAGRPALFASDSSFSAFYPDYHRPSDAADKLDAPALERMGRGVLGVARALAGGPRGPDEQPQWFAAFGRVIDGVWLLALGALALAPGLRAGTRAGTSALAVRLLQAGAFLVLLWLHTVPALWVFLVPLVLLPFTRRWWALALALLPLTALVAIGVSAWWRGAANGVWLEPWELAVAGVALALSFLWPGGSGGGRGKRKSRGGGGKAWGRRRGRPA